MAESEQRPLEEVLFGPVLGAPTRPESDLAEAVSAWFRASRAKLRDGAVVSTSSARAPVDSHPPPA